MERPKKPDLLGPPPPKGEGPLAWFGWIVMAPLVAFGGLVAYLFYPIELLVFKIANRIAPEIWQHPRLNGAQARVFLYKLKYLSDSAWQRIEASEKGVRSAYGWYKYDDIALASLMALGGRRADQLHQAIEDRLPSTLASSRRHTASVAVQALVLAGELTDAQVVASYAMFSEEIPVGMLGPGRAPLVEPPPRSPWERFVTRLRGLDNRERAQALSLAYSIESAVGVDEIDRAIGLEDFADPSFFSPACQEISKLTRSSTSAQIELFDLLGKASGNQRFANEHSRRLGTESDAFELSAIRALGAVLSHGRMPEREFAVLYTPFAGLIPIDALEEAEQRDEPTTAPQQPPSILFDPSPQERSWTDVAVPGREMVGALGFSGRDVELNLEYAYKEFDVPTVCYGVALVMEGILREYPLKSALRDATAGDVSPFSGFEALLTDVRDFLRARYRCEGLSIDRADAISFVRNASSFADRGPDWIINLVVTALDPLLNADQAPDEPLLFRATVRGIRDLCRGVHRQHNPRLGTSSPIIDEMLREHFKE